jgi:hypothetical protein
MTILSSEGMDNFTTIFEGTPMDSITWAALATGVPTLSQAMLMLLGLLLVAVAYVFHRPGGGMHRLMSMMVLIAAAAILVNPLIEVVRARSPALITVQGEDCSRGNTATFSRYATFTSECASAIRITAITCVTEPTSLEVEPESASQNGYAACEKDAVLSGGDSCSLVCGIAPG